MVLKPQPERACPLNTISQYKHSFPVHRRILRMQRIVCNAAAQIQLEVVQAAKGFRMMPWLITLTYKDVDGYQPGHIQPMLDYLYKWLKRQRVKHWCSLWVAELQQRGAVHYHIAIWLPYGVTPPKPDKQGWWKHGSTNVRDQSRRKHRNIISYLAKYISKGTGARAFPKNCRTYGFRNLSPQANFYRRKYTKLPAWLIRILPDDATADRCREWPDYWYSEDTGKSYRSPYELDWKYSKLTEYAPSPYDTLPFDIDFIEDMEVFDGKWIWHTVNGINADRRENQVYYID